MQDCELIVDGDLSRKLKINLTVDELSQVFQLEIQKLTKNAKLSGFRAGKVPRKIIEQKYGQSVLLNAVNDVMQKKVDAFLKDREDIMVADKLSVTYPDDISLKQDIECYVNFQVYPEFDLPDFSKIEVKKIEFVVSEKDVDDALFKIRKRQSTFQPSNEPAKHDDVVTIGCEVKLKETQKKVQGMCFDRVDFHLDGSFIPDMYNAICGLSIGDKAEFESKAPAVKGVLQEIVGKDAVFNIEVCDIRYKVLPEMDDDFAKNNECNDLNELREKCREKLEKDAKNLSLQNLHKSFNEILYKMDVRDKLPKCALKNEVVSIKDDIDAFSADFTSKEIDEYLAKCDDAVLEKAKDFITFRIMVAKIIKKHDIRVGPNDFSKDFGKDSVPIANALKKQDRHDPIGAKEYENIKRSLFSMLYMDKVFGVIEDSVKIVIEEKPYSEFSDV